MQNLKLWFSTLTTTALILYGCSAEDSDTKVEESSVRTVSQKVISTTCAANAVGNPEQLVWTFHDDVAEPYYSATIVVEEADFVIDGNALHTRAYHQPGHAPSIPGPTIHMDPGNKYVLHFENRLPEDAGAEPVLEHNIFRNHNHSNLHTHGLHISGETPSDDVTRDFPGGTGGDFVYDIPADHMGGTFWYHAHYHGSTWLQISGGTFGLMTIGEQNDGLPANVAAMEKRELVFGLLDPGTADEVTSNQQPGGDPLLEGNFGATWTVNGVPNGSLCMPDNEWQRFRVLVADPDADNREITFGNTCEVMLLARDGVWRTTAPAPFPRGGNSISLTGASRADFAVRCDGDTDIQIDGDTVAEIVVDGVGNTAVHPYAEGGNAEGGNTWSANRPDYLQDLRNAQVDNSETVNIGGGARTINGDQFDPDVATFTTPVGGVNEYTLNGTANHPYHFHVYHMQSQNCAGGADDYEDGEFYDVIARNCDIRFDLDPATTTPFSGRTVMHCHILEHEDEGLMGWTNVIGGEGPPSFPSESANPALPFADFRDTLPEPGNGDPCGDGICDPATEDSCSCAADCGAPPTVDTTCDGFDDDCDGNIDDDFVESSTSCGDGVCASTGTSSCVDGNVVDTCAPDTSNQQPNDASCDGQDNDCDGSVDEDFASTPTSCGEGVCASTGSNSCVNGNVVDTCSPDTSNQQANDASCDGQDNDCDGSVDEDFVSSVTSCGLGVCADTGVNSCVNGNVIDTCSPDTTNQQANDASCDGQDNDCDGSIDEDFASTPTSCGVGECSANGATTCNAGVIGDSCEAGTPAADDATCDNLDNDCDGDIDEDFVAGPTSCGEGVCASTGTNSCVNGNLVDTCSPDTTNQQANDATCNGVDNDCDGSIDEDFASTPTSCGVGECAATGATTCSAGVIGDSCSAGAPAANDASCDNLDNDCDGDIDEDFAPVLSLCGVGACESTGQISCVAGSQVDSCTPGIPAASELVCDDSVDADCDGDVDCDDSDCSSDALCDDGGPIGDAELDAEVVITNDWGFGYCANLVVTNTSDAATYDWSVVVDPNGTNIYTAWNLDLIDLFGFTAFEPPGNPPQNSWIRAIQPGASTQSLGFCAQRDGFGFDIPTVVDASAVY